MSVTLPGTGTVVASETENSTQVQRVRATGDGDVLDVTLSLNTSGAYADGDVLADTQVVTNAVRIAGGRATLQTVHVHDEDDQGQPFDLLFLDANNSIGTENAAPTITDANGRAILGKVSILSGDYYDMQAFRVATKTAIGLLLKAGSGTRDLYVAAISRGTGTYTASGIRLKLGFEWD